MRKSKASKEKNSLQKSQNGRVDNVDKAVDNVKKLPPDQRNQVVQKLEMFSGPVPPPHILEKYNKIDPGAAKQIIDNGVAESEHRRELESSLLDAQTKRHRRRDWMAFIIGIIAILVGAFLIYKDHYIVGTIFSGVSILGLVAQFLDDNNSRQNNDDEHDN